MNQLSEIYHNVNHPAGYSSLNNLYQNVKELYSKNQIKEFLSGQDSYTLHKPARKHFKRNKYLLTNIDDMWEIDLIDMHNYKDQNDGYNFILSVIDTFSKYAWCKLLKNKTGHEVARALESIFEEELRKPNIIRSDKGEFQ